MLEKLHFHEEKDTIYFLGDIVDRGPMIKETVEYIRDLVDIKCAHMLLGNHELMWIDYFNWKTKGIYPSYYMDTDTGIQCPDDFIFSQAQWFLTLKTYIELDHYLLVHGGLYHTKSLEDHTTTELVWCRDHEYVPLEYRHSKRIIHGHTPVRSPYIAPDQINIDTGCVFNNELTSIRIDNYPSYTICSQYYKG